VKFNRSRIVVFLLSSLEVGGTETYLLQFLKHTQGAFQAIVLCKSGNDGPLLPDYERVGVRVVRLGVGNSLSFRYIQLYRFFRQSQVDCVCDLTGDFGGLPMLTSWFAGVDRRLVFYRNWTYRFKPTLARLAFAKFLGMLVFRFSTIILSNSESALDAFQPSWRIHSNRFGVVRNPAPPSKVAAPDLRATFRRRIGVPEDAFIVAHVGRVASSKNHDFIFSVADTVMKSHPEFHFVLCGRGLEKKYGFQLTNTQFASRYHMYEYRRDIFDLLSCADIFFFPSLSEGMPNALVEAMAARCPCIASDIPPIREIFPLAYSHYLIDPRNVKSAASMLVELSRSATRKQYGQVLHQWAIKKFDRKRNFGAFLSMLGCQDL